jgi:hypothetical protein
MRFCERTAARSVQDAWPTIEHDHVAGPQGNVLQHGHRMRPVGGRKPDQSMSARHRPWAMSDRFCHRRPPHQSCRHRWQRPSPASTRRRTLRGKELRGRPDRHCRDCNPADVGSRGTGACRSNVARRLPRYDIQRRLDATPGLSLAPIGAPCPVLLLPGRIERVQQEVWEGDTVLWGQDREQREHNAVPCCIAAGLRHGPGPALAVRGGPVCRCGRSQTCRCKRLPAQGTPQAWRRQSHGSPFSACRCGAVPERNFISRPAAVSGLTARRAPRHGPKRYPNCASPSATSSVQTASNATRSSADRVRAPHAIE